jgi:molybdopterin-guanine dinucleotide biosynthesis protein A
VLGHICCSLAAETGSSELGWSLPATVVLAGGKSKRMGKDKAFLTYCGRSFVEIVVEKALKVSVKVVVCIGSKDRGMFEALLPRNVLVVNDRVNLGTPLSGVLTGFEVVDVDYAALVGCDMPLIREEVLTHLASLARGHSAAIPRWPSGEAEPLLAVYNVGETLDASRRAVSDGKLGLKHLFEYLADVLYVDVNSLKRFDARLESLKNINTPQDYQELKLSEHSVCGRSGFPTETS